MLKILFIQSCFEDITVKQSSYFEDTVIKFIKRLQVHLGILCLAKQLLRVMRKKFASLTFIISNGSTFLKYPEEIW